MARPRKPGNPRGNPGAPIIVPPGSATVAWTAPTTNSAGQSFDSSSNDRTLSLYRIYYATNQASVIAGSSASVTVVPPTVNYTFTPLAAGTWHFRVTAVDGDGDESLNIDTYSKVVA